jgi:hypothetical protein
LRSGRAERIGAAPGEKFVQNHTDIDEAMLAQKFRAAGPLERDDAAALRRLPDHGHNHAVAAGYIGRGDRVCLAIVAQ